MDKLILNFTFTSYEIFDMFCWNDKINKHSTILSGYTTGQNYVQFSKIKFNKVKGRKHK